MGPRIPGSWETQAHDGVRALVRTRRHPGAAQGSPADGRRLLAGLALALTALFAARVAAAPVSSYLQLSESKQAQGSTGFEVSEGGLNVAADLTFRAADGRAEARPKVQSSFALGDDVRVQTNLRFADWGDTDSQGTASDTKISFGGLPAFIQDFEGHVRRTPGSASTSSLKVGFADLLDKTHLFGRNIMDVKTALTVEDEGARRAVLDTRFMLHGLPPFVDALEGRIRRTTDGALLQSLKFGFSERFGVTGRDRAPLSIRGKATFEQSVSAGGPPAVKIGFETDFAGFMPSIIPGRDELKLRLLNGSAVPDGRSTSLAYDHAWSAFKRAAEVAFKLELQRAAGITVPSLAVTWNARF